MNNDKTGGPAYLIYTQDMSLGDDAGPGMTLRDHFAGQALAGFCANASSLSAITSIDGPDNAAKNLATAVYEFANAMIQERGKDDDTV